jgi:uncharacterized membrane protein YbhN (UPF0104 family)
VHSLHAFWNATSAFADHLSQVGVGALLLGLLLHFANLLLRATAWRNILAAAHPQRRIRWRTVTGAYLAGVGLNSVVPARGGDVMKVYLVHRTVPDTPYTTITSSLLTETLFDAVVGSALLVWAVSAGVIPGAPDLSGRLAAFEWSFFAEHMQALAFVVAMLLIALAICFSWLERRANRFWDGIKDGLAILTTPRRYLREVVALQGLGWICRAAAMYFFLSAFGIPADLSDATLALSAGSIATLLPLTPGGIGPQQALLVYMFDGAATRGAVLSFSVGMQFAITVANAVVGFVCLGLMLGKLPWKARRPGPGAAVPSSPHAR